MAVLELPWDWNAQSLAHPIPVKELEDCVSIGQWVEMCVCACVYVCMYACMYVCARVSE